MQKDPVIMRRVGQILLMGGALDTRGNITDFTEFNAHCDPKALGIVLNSGIRITLFPLDVTEQVRLQAWMLEQQRDIEPNELRLIRDVITTYMEFHRVRYGFKGCFIHDALPVASLIDPSIFTFVTAPVVIEQTSLENAGQMRWDERGAHIQVAMHVDEEKLLNLFWDRLRRSLGKCKYVSRVKP